MSLKPKHASNTKEQDGSAQSRQSPCSELWNSRPKFTREAFLSLVILLSLSLSACSNRAKPHEKPLLFSSKVEKYWTCTLNTPCDTAVGGKDAHQCLLVTYSPTDHGNFTHFFLSQWSDCDSTYRQGMRSSNADVWSGQGKWPLSVYIPGDSAHADWRMYFGPRKIWLNGEFASPSRSPFSTRGTSFMVRYDERPDHPSGIATPGVQLYQYRIPGDNLEYDGLIQLAAFPGKDGLVGAGSAKATYWINLVSTGLGDHTSLLLQLGDDGQLTTLGSDHSYHPHGVRYPAVCAILPGSTWESPSSRKAYALGVDVDMGWNHYLVRPKALDQEIHAGKNSFWMGAVEVLDPVRGVSIGSGNMYVFTR